MRAAGYFIESLNFAQAQGDQEEIGECLIGLAGVAGSGGKFERATRLFGAVESMLVENGYNLDPANRSEFDRAITTMRAQLVDESFAATWAAGCALTLEQAIAEALNVS